MILLLSIYKDKQPRPRVLPITKALAYNYSLKRFLKYFKINLRRSNKSPTIANRETAKRIKNKKFNLKENNMKRLINYFKNNETASFCLIVATIYIVLVLAFAALNNGFDLGAAYFGFFIMSSIFGAFSIDSKK